MDAHTHKYTHAHTHTDKSISTYSMHVTSVHVPAATSDSQWDDIKKIVGGVEVPWKEWYPSISRICAVDQVRGGLYNDLYICRLHRYGLVAICFIVARISQETLKQIRCLWKIYTLCLCSHKRNLEGGDEQIRIPVHIMTMQNALMNLTLSTHFRSHITEGKTLTFAEIWLLPPTRAASTCPPCQACTYSATHQWTAYTPRATYTVQFLSAGHLAHLYL